MTYHIDDGEVVATEIDVLGLYMPDVALFYAELTKDRSSGCEKDSPCGVRWWTSTAPCPTEPGEHACWRTSEHRTHLCGCGEIRIPPARSTSDERCGYRWSDGRSCADGTAHVCTRAGEHGTHVCHCLASDTPSRVVAV